MKRLWYVWKYRKFRREVAAYHRAGRLHPSEVGNQVIITDYTFTAVDPMKVRFEWDESGVTKVEETP